MSKGVYHRYKKIPIRVIKRYWLFQIPGFLLIGIASYLLFIFTTWPWWIFAIVISLWLIKDITLLPITWQSYDVDQARMQHSMNHKIGIVKKELNPEGIVQIGIEKWNAVSDGPDTVIPAGQEVIVIEQMGLKLIVSQKK